MKSEHKALSIIAIWFATAGIMAMLFLGRDVDLGGGVLAFFILAFAAISTTEIAGSKVPQPVVTQTSEKVEKAKNRASARVDKLLSGLSEDDLVTLRRRLADDDSVRISNDGELVTLEQALRGRR
ncbi:MAG: hypothetical protein SF123_06865 [Chloroflexota bacterium]|nr:hypothetical protein [Chloroflexota bacterium]